MIEHAVTPAVLPAGYGDCLLIQCPVGERTWRMLADTVSDETLAQLKAGLAALPFDADGKRDIDLFIEPRFDHDRTGGVGLLLIVRSAWPSVTSGSTHRHGIWCAVSRRESRWPDCWTLQACCCHGMPPSAQERRQALEAERLSSFQRHLGRCALRCCPRRQTA